MLTTVVILALALGGVSTVAVAMVHRLRSQVASLDRLTERLTGAPPPPERRRSLTRAMARLQRALDEKEEANARLGAERDRLGRALDGIPEGVVITDESGAVVFRNRAALTFASARHADALVEAAVAQLSAEAVQGSAGRRTLDLFGPPRRTLVISATPLTSPLGIGALAIIDDVSERRRLEAVRRDFVANISHELKTPVGALGLLAETLVAEDDPEVSRRLAGRIQTEAFRVGRTIEDLLELSRIESGEMPHRDRVAVQRIVAEAVERIRPAAEHAGIEIVIHDVPRRLAVFGDRRQLVSALYNLLDNAVKYSDAGSTVEVEARTDGTTVDLSVRDHGIGIPARDLERVFERFYRVDQARSRQTGGTGLGLAIVRHVVQNHEGTVHVESRLGEGSTFTLRLPTASGPVALSGTAGSGRAAGGAAAEAG